MPSYWIRVHEKLLQETEFLVEAENEKTARAALLEDQDYYTIWREHTLEVLEQEIVEIQKLGKSESPPHDLP